MVTVGDEIINGFPEPTIVPPQLVLNQRAKVPEPPETEREILPPVFEQKLFISDVPETGATGKGITVTSKEIQDDEAQLLICHLA